MRFRLEFPNLSGLFSPPLLKAKTDCQNTYMLSYFSGFFVVAKDNLSLSFTFCLINGAAVVSASLPQQIRKV